MKSLVRLRCGPFDIKDAVSVPQLEDAARDRHWHHFVHPIDTVLLDWPAIVVGDTTANAVKNGQALTVADDDSLKCVPNGSRCRAYTNGGTFLGVVRFNRETGQWHPEKFFPIGTQQVNIKLTQERWLRLTSYLKQLVTPNLNTAILQYLYISNYDRQWSYLFKWFAAI